MTPRTRGVTLIELVIAITAGLVLLAAAVPFFSTGSRAMEQQSAVRDVQVALHVSAETLLRGIRSAASVQPGSDDGRLVLEDGELTVPCGDDVFWIAIENNALRCGPDGGAGEHILSRDVTGFDLTYGIDTSGNGIVDTFQSNPSGGDLDDVLAVRFVLEASRVEGRSEALITPEFVAVIRNAVFSRLELES